MGNNIDSGHFAVQIEEEWTKTNLFLKVGKSNMCFNFVIVHYEIKCIKMYSSIGMYEA